MSNKKTIMLSALSILVGTAAFGEITTGWQSPLEGTYGWADTANWVNGEINGIFSSGLVGSKKNYLNITFAADTELPDGLNFGFVNFEQFLTLMGDSAPRTLKLDNAIVVNVGGATKGAIAFGNTDATKVLNIDLNGDRTFLFENWGANFYGTIGGGNLLVTGNDANNANLLLAGNAGCIESGCSVTMTAGRGLYLYGKDKYITGCHRADTVRIEGGFLLMEGNEGSSVVDSLGEVTFAPGSRGGLVRIQSYCTTSKYKNYRLNISKLIREGKPLVEFQAASGALGTTDFGNGSVNVMVESGLDMIGGESGTVTAPVIPWMRERDDTNLTGDGPFERLMTYDSSRGLRVLSAAEQESYDGGFVGPVTTTGANVIANANGDVEFTGDNTVNSLKVTASGSGGLVATSGVLRVTSGALDFSASRDYLYVDANIDFGDADGYITDYSQKKSNFRGTIGGNKDVILANNLLRSDFCSAPISMEANGTFAGDLYINGSLGLANANFLPSGARKGRVINRGLIRLTCNDGKNYLAVRMNGLDGSGRITLENSYYIRLEIGDNDADGSYAGTIQRTGGNMRLHKIGAGCQSFGGDVSVNQEIVVNGGTAIFDGEVAASSVTVADGAAIGGKGVINTSLAFTGNATLAASKGEGRALAPLTVNGAVTAGGTITVSAASEDWRGESCVLASTEPLTGITFAKGANIKGLELRNDGKELWARNIKGLIVIIK